MALDGFRLDFPTTFLFRSKQITNIARFFNVITPIREVNRC